MSTQTIIIILLFIEAISSNIVIFDLQGYNYNRPLLSVDFPNENVKHRLELNTYLNFSAFDLDNMQSSRIIDSNCHLLLENYIDCSLYYTDLKIQNQLLVENFTLFISSGIHLARDNGIGLGYHFNNDSYSLVHHLYKTLNLDHLQFSFP